jgi:hypothetical protein
VSYRLIDHESEGRTDKVSAMRGHSDFRARHFSDMAALTDDVRFRGDGGSRISGPRGPLMTQSRRGSLNDRTPRRLGGCCQQLPMTPSKYWVL